MKINNTKIEVCAVIVDVYQELKNDEDDLRLIVESLIGRTFSSKEEIDAYLKWVIKSPRYEVVTLTEYMYVINDDTTYMDKYIGFAQVKHN